MSKNKYIKIGAIKENKNGGFYLKLDESIKLEINGELVEGTLSLDTPQQKLAFFLEKGIIDEAKYEERISKVPEFVKYEVTAVVKK
jgi:hypothetical protein